MRAVAEGQHVRHALGYGSTPIGGELLRRLSEGEVPAGFPLLDVNRPTVRDEPALLDRDALADALATSNAAMGNALSDETIDAIRTDGWMVVAGQQPGLLMGPLYTAYKAVSTIGLARCLCESGVRAIPAFWIASEDHDLAEVDHFSIGTRGFRADHRGLRDKADRPPVGTVELATQREAVLRLVEQALPPTEHRAWVLETIGRADFTNYTSLFASLFVGVFGAGRVVLIDPMRLRAVLAPALAHVMDRWDEAERGFEQGTARLREAGYESQLERLTVFEVVDGVRRPIRGGVSGQQILDDPERFSPGAGVRPIVQDSALPVLATVSGPSELLYQWQIDGVYEAVGLTRSRLYPRQSVTWVEPYAMRIAERFGLDGRRVFEAVGMHAEFDPTVLMSDTREAEELARLRDELLAQMSAADDGRNRKLMGRALRSVEHHVNKVLLRMRLDQLEGAGLGVKSMGELVEAIQPGGRPQERVTNVFELIARHGPGVIDRLIETSDYRAIAHDVIVTQGAIG